MKTIYFLLLFLLAALFQAKAQSTPADGHILQWVQDNVKVYQAKDGEPILTAYKFWNYKFWFYANDGTVKGSDNQDYVEIFIPQGDEKTIKITDEIKPWNKDSVLYITKADTNKWLFLSKSDYDKLQQDHYPKRTYGLVASAMTVPFKIHPATDGHASSLYNSNWNAGTFIGLRLGFLNDYTGVTLGGMFGVTSLSQSSAENTAITDNSSITMTAVTYGAGLIFDVGRKFQIGTVLGWDHGYGDKSSTYIYQNKSWFALSLNFNFLDLSKTALTQN